MADSEIVDHSAGVFESPLAEYPGHIRLPHPFLARHYKAWHRAIRAGFADADDIDGSEYFNEWRGAVALIEAWRIKGVPYADVNDGGDNVPLEVVSWVVGVVSEYILPKLDLKNLHGPSETM